MGLLYIILYALVFIVLTTGLIMSMRIRGRQKTEIDTGVSDRIKENKWLLNPIFWAYGLAAAIGFILIWFFKEYYGAPF